MNRMGHNGFEGWYFKHQKGERTLAFIVGRAQSGAFVQLAGDGFSRRFAVRRFSNRQGVLRADACRFTRAGCTLALPGVQGALRYGPLAPLRGDIMGPLRFLPLQCRHAVISMAHPLRGCVTVEGERYDFDGGMGYIEADFGTSFPRGYLWLHGGGRTAGGWPVSVMLAVAQVALPNGGLAFPGCIGVVWLAGQQVRFATYLGARIHALSPQYVCVSQGVGPARRQLEVTVLEAEGGQTLAAPQQGRMCAAVRETHSAVVRIRYWQTGRLVLDWLCRRASFEVREAEAQK